MIKNRKILLSHLFITIFLQASFSQLSIKATIVNSKKEVIEFANVSLLDNANGNLLLGTISDEQGEFVLQIKEHGSYLLEIKFIGYEVYSKTLNVNGELLLGEIILNASTNDLDEVVVTADRGIFENKNGKTIFNVDKSPFKNGFDGMEVLERSPGVLTDAQGNLTISNQAAIVHVNGRRINLSGEELLNYIANINSENIQSIQVQRHLTASTGSVSAGGIINIILKRKAIGFDGSARLNFVGKAKQKYSFNSNFNLNYGSEKWNFYSSLSYFNRDDLFNIDGTIDYYETKNLLANTRISNIINSRPNARLGFVGNISKQHVIGLEGFWSMGSNRLQIDSKVNVTNRGNYLDDGLNFFKDSIEIATNHLLFNYTWTLDTLDSNLKLYLDYSNQNFDSNSGANSIYHEGLYQNTNERSHTESVTDIKNVQIDFNKSFGKQFKMTIGTRYLSTLRKNSLLAEDLNQGVWKKNDRSNDFDYSEKLSAVYASVSISTTKRSHLQFGLRFDHTDLEKIDILENDLIQKDYNNWLPDLLFSQELNDKNSLSFSYSRRLRRPAFWRITNSVLKRNDFTYVLGNPDLTPELVDGFELAWNQKKQTFRIYHDKVNDAINGIYFLEGEISFYKPFNSGSQVQVGGEYNRFGNLNSWWYVNATLGFYNRKFLNEEKEISFQRNSYYINMSHNFKLNKTTTFELSAYYYSPLEDAFYISGHRFRINLYVQKAFLKDKLSARIYYRDIFNTLYYTAERPFDNFKTTAHTKPLTRSIRIQISYRFSDLSKLKKRKNTTQNDARRRM